ncbi:hypothetical protein CLOP_g8804 [Closterium sp. NIES-67]|nr:hypothetical protein CLOP_g8804 [Closterium sp. NIES-67]
MATSKALRSAARSRWPWPRIAGAAILAGATLGVTYSVADDVLLFYRCSSEALEVANQNEQLKAAIGSPVRRGPWYNATIGITHGGRAASATFPVEGPKGSALFHLRAIRTHGGRSTLLYNLQSDPKWQLFVLQATVAPRAVALPEEAARPAPAAPGASPATAAAADAASAPGTAAAPAAAPAGPATPAAPAAPEAPTTTTAPTAAPLSFRIDLLYGPGGPSVIKAAAEETQEGECLPCQARAPQKPEKAS